MFNNYSKRYNVSRYWHACLFIFGRFAPRNDKMGYTFKHAKLPFQPLLDSLLCVIKIFHKLEAIPICLPKFRGDTTELQ